MDPSVLSSVDSAAGPAPPPLMSVHVQPPQQSQGDELVLSQASLSTESEDSIAEFSEGEPSVASPSPTISSFPSDVTIVSNDPMEVEQIDCNSNVTGLLAQSKSNEDVTGLVAQSKDNCNVTGPKVAHSNCNSNVTGPQSNSKSNVTGPKVAQGNSNVTGPKVAQSNNKSNSNVTGPKVALSKSNVTGPTVAHINSNSQTDLPNSQSQNSSIGSHGQIQQYDFLSAGHLVDSDSSSSESLFKPPLPPRPSIPPRPRRTSSQSPQRGRSRSPLVPGSPGAHRGMPQVSKDRPSRRS